MKNHIPIALLLLSTCTFIFSAQGKTNKQDEAATAASPSSFPAICGVWDGKVGSDGLDLVASLRLFPDGDGFQGSLTAAGKGGTSKHFLNGHYDEKAKHYIFHDTRVERVLGQSDWKPEVMTQYTLKLSIDGKSLKGSCHKFASSDKITLSLDKTCDISKDQILKDAAESIEQIPISEVPSQPSKPNDLDDLALEVRRASATYSGGSDYFDSIQKESAARWPKTLLPLKVYIEPGDQVHNYRDTYRQSIITAFNDWTKAANDRLSWRLVNRKSDASIICTWVSKKEELPLHKQREQGVTDYATVTLSKTDERWLQKVVITICTSNIFSTRALKTDDVFNVARHEVGHALGLTGHSSSKGDVMYPTMSQKLMPISMRDAGTINHLYAYYTTTPWD